MPEAGCGAAARGGEHAGDRVRVEARLGLEHARGLVVPEGGAVRPVGRERGEDVRGGEDPVGARQRVGAERAVVPGAVEPLVVRRGRGEQSRERPAADEDPLRVVGVQPHPLVLRRRERAGLVPDPVLHRDAAHIVEEPGAPQLVARLVAEPGLAARRRRRARPRGVNARGATAT